MREDLKDVATNWEAWGQRLCSLGLEIRSHMRQQLRDSSWNAAEPVGHESGDTIYAIDRCVEPVINRIIESWPETCKPLLLIAEGMGKGGRKRFGPEGQSLKYRLLVDPIDGTRNLMYDKRSAWFLSTVASDHGEATCLHHARAAAIVELPTTKQSWADCFVAANGGPVRGQRINVETNEDRVISICRSKASTLEHGFAQVSNFFPATKVLASELMERIAERTLAAGQPGQSLIFDDQYICTGGQMVELMVGHDRFCCDLRPLFYKILAKQHGDVVTGVECHPYDCAAALVAKESGVILTDGLGKPLNPPFDVTTPVHWCGYANEEIRDRVEPVIKEWLDERGDLFDKEATFPQPLRYQTVRKSTE